MMSTLDNQLPEANLCLVLHLSINVHLVSPFLNLSLPNRMLTLVTMSKQYARNIKFSANISSLFLDIPDHLESYREIINRLQLIVLVLFYIFHQKQF